MRKWCEQPARFFDPMAHLEHIANDHNLIDMFSAKEVECRLQMFDMLVDVGQQAQFHLCLRDEATH